MAFAQLTWREIAARHRGVPGGQSGQAVPHGVSKAPPARSTLADANERARLAHLSRSGAAADRARHALYAQRPLRCWNSMPRVYALDSTTIDLCLSLFDWAPFRSTKAAIKLHTLLDLRGAIPTFIHISDGKLHDVNVLDMLPIEAGAFYVMDRGYVDFARLYALHQAGAFFVTRAKRDMDARRVYSAPIDRTTGVICDQRVDAQRLLLGQGLSRASAAHPLQGPRVRQDAGLPDQQHCACRR